MQQHKLWTVVVVMMLSCRVACSFVLRRQEASLFGTARQQMSARRCWQIMKLSFSSEKNNGMSNAERRQKAFESIISDAPVPKASSTPPMEFEEEESSLFDFGELEEPFEEDIMTTNSEEEYPLHLYQTGNEEKQPSPPHTIIEQDTSKRASVNGSTSMEKRNEFLEKASYGNGVTTNADMLSVQLQKVEKEIYALNNNKPFNINSPKQVSTILFGKTPKPQSTNKETLQAMGAAGNKMADLILQYRTCSRAMKRAQHNDGAGKKNRVFNVSHNGNNNGNDNKEALILVDASAYIFRAYYSMPPIHRTDGMPVGAVLGFCNMINRLVLHRLLNGDCPHLVLVFDAKGKTFRHDMYEDYKANRKECPMDLVPQFDLIRDVAKAYGIQQLEAINYEADDVIATLAGMAIKEGFNVNILSGDKDLMQLVTPEDAVPSIHMIDPMKMSRITHDVVVEKWGVPPRLVGDLLALAGDASDNIPGIPGVGPKIAALLLEQFGTLEDILEKADTIPQKARREKVIMNKEKALLSKRLVELERQIPLENMTFPVEVSKVADLRMERLDSERLIELYDELGFKDLKRRFKDRLMQRDRKEEGVSTRKTKRPRSNKREKAGIPQPEDYEQVPF